MPSKKNEYISKTLENIARLAYKRGVTLDIDSDTQAAPSAWSYSEEDKVLIVYTVALTLEEQDGLIPIVQHYFEKYGLVSSYEQEEIFEKYSEYDDTNPHRENIEYFAPVIPTKDLEALKMSYYMMDEKENGANIEGHKFEIRERFGPRGSYIANLCYAGYYDGIFRSKRSSLSAEKFSQYYELRVGLELAALFVHTGMNIKTMANVFQEKVSLCMLNGVGKFRIHGFGKKNVEFVKEFFLRHEDFDWGVDIEIKVMLEAPSAIEYDIIMP